MSDRRKEKRLLRREMIMTKLDAEGQLAREGGIERFKERYNTSLRFTKTRKRVVRLVTRALSEHRKTIYQRVVTKKVLVDGGKVHVKKQGPDKGQVVTSKEQVAYPVIHRINLNTKRFLVREAIAERQHRAAIPARIKYGKDA